MKFQTLIYLVMATLLASCGAFEASDNSDRKENPDDSRQGNNNEPTSDVEPLRTEDLPEALNSQIFRSKGTKIYKYGDESALTRADELPSTLHPVPDKVAHDMDKLTGRVNKGVNCGIDLDDSNPTITKRMNDCKSKNSSDVLSYYWSGKDNGLAGENDWRLVARNGDKAIWLDVATGLIWSPSLPQNTWDLASGNVEEAEQICNGANDTSSKNFFLGIKADEVSWRLPTRGDFLQADLNGSRFVLPADEEALNYWTANYISDEASAWSIELSSGILSKTGENNSLAIRCVGSVLK